MIDAVQELIQTHEACEQSGESFNKCEEELKQERVDRGPVHDDSCLQNTVADSSVILSGEEEGKTQVISEEVWKNLRAVYPDAEFVVVDNQ